jgi:uncharacterized repeat protein (TIGR03803 family)
MIPGDHVPVRYAITYDALFSYTGGAANAGVVYMQDTKHQETVLYSFTGGADGGYPHAGVIRDSAGNLYGTTYKGGTAGYGVVYELSAIGQEVVLYSFTGGADGGNPEAGVMSDSAGNLYGTTVFGGTINATCPSGCGVVYKLDAAGQETVLHSFGGADGCEPTAGVIRDSPGNLCGTTLGGGTSRAGVVFKVNTVGQETVLYSFTGGTDGNPPRCGSDPRRGRQPLRNHGYGGTAGAGVVYMLDTKGQETVLYSFTGGADGSEPNAGVIRDSAGGLFGTIFLGGKTGNGVVFTVEP